VSTEGPLFVATGHNHPS